MTAGTRYAVIIIKRIDIEKSRTRLILRLIGMAEARMTGMGKITRSTSVVTSATPMVTYSRVLASTGRHFKGALIYQLCRRLPTVGTWIWQDLPVMRDRMTLRYRGNDYDDKGCNEVVRYESHAPFVALFPKPA